MRDTISYDAMIEDVAPTLNGPAEFVRRVLANCYEVKSTERSGLQVRIGVRGRGIRPNYRIEWRTDVDRSNGPPDHKYKYLDAYVIGVFRGSNHNSIEDSSADTNWSSGTTTFDALGRLLLELAPGRAVKR